jgi:hypothetical protein
LPFEIWLARPGGPLEGLRGGRVEYGRIRARYYLSVWAESNGTFWVMTIGHTAQTQRRRQFGSRQAAVEYANAWLASTVERGRARFEQQQVTIH